MTTVNGLPAHILLVHAIVVLLPLSALVLVLTACLAPVRRRLAGANAILSVLVVILVPITTDAGEWLERRVARTPLVRAHTEIGDTAIWVAIPVAVLALALWWRQREAGGGAGSGASAGLAASVVDAGAVVAGGAAAGAGAAGSAATGAGAAAPTAPVGAGAAGAGAPLGAGAAGADAPLGGGAAEPEAPVRAATAGGVATRAADGEAGHADEAGRTGGASHTGGAEARRRRVFLAPASKAVTVTLTVLSVLAAGAAVYDIVRIGDSGAQASWQGQFQQNPLPRVR